jgi:hypothetical protein
MAKQYIQLLDNKIFNIIMVDDNFLSTVSDTENYISYDSISVNNRKTIRVGNFYDSANSRFVPVKPLSYPSWIFDETNYRWVPPIEIPKDGKPYVWDEPSVNWKEFVEEETPSE